MMFSNILEPVLTLEGDLGEEVALWRSTSSKAKFKSPCNFEESPPTYFLQLSYENVDIVHVKNMISYCGNQTTEKNVKYETKKVT
jgi:hypothetical protein